MPKPEYVQPEYKKWTSVQIGMSRDEVVEKLGLPLDDEYRGGQSKPNDSYYSYGHLQMPMISPPTNLQLFNWL